LKSDAQVIGGSRVFEFLRLSASPHISALGGMVVANPSPDLMMGYGNPALLRPEFHSTLGLNHNIYYAGSQFSNFLYAHHVDEWNTTLGVGVQFLNYGKFTYTDGLGNIYGEGQASDYAIHLIASKSYKERWRYGAAIKFAQAQYTNGKSSALAADIGVVYADTNNKWYVGGAFKNAGYQIKRFDPSIDRQPLPFDLQIGVTKKFKKAPFSIMVLAHHLYTWDIRYDNPTDANNTSLLFGDENKKEKNYFADKLFRHFVFAADVQLGKRLELSVGYNHLRRSELALDEKKGASGFSFGAGLYLNKFVIHYARSYYHIVGPFNEIGINIKLNQLIGLGNMGGKINWSEKYARAYPQ
jgi:hypothetical protein